jgi:hypothetical protein
MRTVTVIALVLLVGQMVGITDARRLGRRSTWTGTVLGRERSCRGVQVLAGSLDSVDGGFLRCHGRNIFFDTRIHGEGVLVTTGTVSSEKIGR